MAWSSTRIRQNPQESIHQNPQGFRRVRQDEDMYFVFWDFRIITILSALTGGTIREHGKNMRIILQKGLMPGICGTKHMPDTSYAWHMAPLRLAYAGHMPGICLAYGACLLYAWHMQGICADASCENGPGRSFQARHWWPFITL